MPGRATFGPTWAHRRPARRGRGAPYCCRGCPGAVRACSAAEARVQQARHAAVEAAGGALRNGADASSARAHAPAIDRAIKGVGRRRAVGRSPRAWSKIDSWIQRLTVKKRIRDLGVAARAASRLLARDGTAAKRTALSAAASAIRSSQKKIPRRTRSTLAGAAREGRRDAAFVDGLELHTRAGGAVGEGRRQWRARRPVRRDLREGGERPTGIESGAHARADRRHRTIYESRTERDGDAAALCVKSGNACIMRGRAPSRCIRTASRRRHAQRTESRGCRRASCRRSSLRLATRWAS